MHPILRAFPFVAMLALAGCGGSSVSTSNIGPVLAGPNSNYQTATIAPMTPPPAQQVASAQAMTDVTAFIDPAAIRLLSERERTEASAAQFNALQFGRAGAPRAWSGDRGASGQVVVGPPVNVNSLYCREFTHSVTAGGQAYSKRGTACREADGRWNVVAS
jgi:surface antigen